MSKKPDKSDKPNVQEACPTPTITEADKAKALKWFEKGQSLVEMKNYDYAIEAYINGLSFWPEAVEQGHKPCRAAALFRGSKKTSFVDGMRHKTGGKDAKKAMLNAEMLLSKEPQSISHMEALFKNAARGQYIDTVMWIGEIFADAAVREEKPNPARFVLMREVYEKLGDQIADANPKLAIEALERAVEALSRLKVLKPTDLDISTDLRDVAGKLTILKGRYSTADSFVDSIHDSEAQKELHDKDRVVQTDARMDELIADAKSRYDADLTNRRAITELVDLLCRRELEADETKAIGVLVKAFKDIQEYRFKLRADDIRMKQLNRKIRELTEKGDKEEARKQANETLRFELRAFKERAQHYPTDLRVRYEYGKRLFQARQYDDAIPMLQEARNDPKTRHLCSLYIGRCFFEKGYHTQAVDTFREAIEAHEMPDDELGKELHYWLGRSFEADAKKDEALKIYGQLIQWDYNYRNGDVRRRIDDLRAKS